MLYVTGSYNKRLNSYKMHNYIFPYDSTTYIGYTLKQMKKKYRQDNNLKYKHIEWIIV